MAGGEAYLLHRIWQRVGMLPSDVRNLPIGERAFIFASETVRIEHEQLNPSISLK